MLDPRRAFQLLLVIFLKSLRAHWALLLVVGTVLPVALVLGLDAMPFATTPALRSAEIALGMITAMLGVTVLAMPATLSQMRASGELAFFAALPVGRITWLAAFVAAYGLTALPGMALADLVAASPNHQIVPVSLWTLPLALLAFAALAGIGICLGVLARSQTMALALGSLVFLVCLGGMLLFAGTAHLAPATRMLVAFLPSSLASDALAAGLPLGAPQALFADLVLLALYAVAGFVVAQRALPWRVVGKQEVTGQPVPKLP